jgi:hypothetical protein
MYPAGFKPAIPVSERPQTHAYKRHGHWYWLLIDLGIANYLPLVPKMRMSTAIPAILHTP